MKHSFLPFTFARFSSSPQCVIYHSVKFIEPFGDLSGEYVEMYIDLEDFKIVCYRDMTNSSHETISFKLMPERN